MLVLRILLYVEHVVLLQLDVVIIAVLATWHRAGAATAVLLVRGVKAMVENTIAARELDDLVQVHFGTATLLLFLFTDLRVPSNMLVLHTICAYTDSTLVLHFHGDTFLLIVHRLPRVTVDDTPDR
jgi:hypothetical protein